MTLVHKIFQMNITEKNLPYPQRFPRKLTVAHPTVYPFNMLHFGRLVIMRPMTAWSVHSTMGGGGGGGTIH